MTALAKMQRLHCACALVRDGAVLADVGTDHGYLPISLLKDGRISRAVCSDINKGPLSCAKENVKEAGLESYVEFVLCDGARALEGKGITDYAICGMGGELIARIISEAPHLNDSSLSFVLQPMSRPELLREYLWKSGFEISTESYALDEGKYYVVFLARYVGRVRKYTDFEAYFGDIGEPWNFSREKREYLKRRAASLSRIVRGKTEAGISASAELALLSELELRLASSEN